MANNVPDNVPNSNSSNQPTLSAVPASADVVAVRNFAVRQTLHLTQAVAP